MSKCVCVCVCVCAGCVRARLVSSGTAALPLGSVASVFSVS